MPATATGRGAQVILDGDAQAAARGAYAATMDGNAGRMAALELAGTVPDGSTADGSTSTGGAPRAKSTVMPSVTDYCTPVLNCTTVTGNITTVSGTAALTLTGAAFTAADIGKAINVPLAGGLTAVNGLTTTISAVTDATHLTMAANASLSITAQQAVVSYGTDNSVAIQAAHDAAFAAGARFLYFPGGRYFAPNLASCGNVVFVGDGALVAAYKKAIAPLSAQGPYKFDRGIIPSIHLPVFSAAAAPIVVGIGDSIMTVGPDVMAGTESLQSSLQRKLARESNKTITWYSRAWGGSAWRHWDAATVTAAIADGEANALPSWITPNSSSLLDIVKALSPDLVIINLGQNTGGYTIEIPAMYSVIGKILAWAKVPDIMFVTPHCPSVMAPTWGLATNQEPRDQMAAAIRGYCLHNHRPMIDANRWANMARDGRDIMRANMVQVQQSFATTGVPYTYPRATFDYSMIGQFSAAGTILTNMRAGSPFGFQIGSQSDNTFLVWKEGGNFRVSSNLTSSVAALAATDTGVAFPASGILYWEMIVRGNWVQFGFATSFQLAGNYTPVWSGYLERLGGLFYPVLFMTGFNGNTVFLSSISLTELEPIMPTVTDMDMFGIVPDGSGGSITLRGGNGVNHPSTIGVERIFDALLANESFI